MYRTSAKCVAPVMPKPARRRTRWTELVGVFLVVTVPVVGLLFVLCFAVASASSPRDSSRARATARRIAIAANGARGVTGACPTFESLRAEGLVPARTPARDPWGSHWRIRCDAGTTTAGSVTMERLGLEIRRRYHPPASAVLPAAPPPPITAPAEHGEPRTIPLWPARLSDLW